MLNVKFKKVHLDAVIPTKAHPGDAGFDVYSIEDKVIPARGDATVDCGLEFAEIPEGYFVKVEGRSGLSFRYGIMPHQGIIDTGYTGTAGILLRNLKDTDYHVKKGDRIAQFIVYRNYECIMTEGEKAETVRGDSGFGSSGK